MTVIRNLTIGHTNIVVKNNRKRTRGRKIQYITEAVEILANGDIFATSHKSKIVKRRLDPLTGVEIHSKMGKTLPETRLLYEKGDVIRTELYSTKILHKRYPNKKKNENREEEVSLRVKEV